MSLGGGGAPKKKNYKVLTLQPGGVGKNYQSENAGLFNNRQRYDFLAPAGTSTTKPVLLMQTHFPRAPA